MSTPDPSTAPESATLPDGQRALDPGTALGPYSPAILSNGVCYVSGQGGVDFATGDIVPGGVGPETRQTLRNIESILELGGMTLADVLTVTVYLVDIDEWAAMNEEYATFFTSDRPLPARTAIAVAALPKGIRVEITATARAPY
jgi:2-iminobutanoate/2-iminopropanoate deaminase